MKNKQVVCQSQRGDKTEKARLGLVHLGHRSVVMQVWPTWCVLVQRHVPGLLMQGVQCRGSSGRRMATSSMPDFSLPPLLLLAWCYANITGPWADELLALILFEGMAKPAHRPSKGKQGQPGAVGQLEYLL